MITRQQWLAHEAAFGRAMKRRMDVLGIDSKWMAKKWGTEEWYVKAITERGDLPYDDEIKEICKILGMKKRWKGCDAD